MKQKWKLFHSALDRDSINTDVLGGSMGYCFVNIGFT